MDSNKSHYKKSSNVEPIKKNHTYTSIINKIYPRAMIHQSKSNNRKSAIIHNHILSKLLNYNILKNKEKINSSIYANYLIRKSVIHKNNLSQAPSNN
jgi:hypothetical protein